MSSISVSADEQGVIRISGEMVFATVTPLLARIQPLLQGDGELLVDLSAVSDVDSAGLALLLELLEMARTRGVELRFRGLSQALLGIARLSNVEALLPLEE